MFPLISTDGVLGAAWLPTDGYLDPSQLTYALADGARAGRLRGLHEHAGRPASTSTTAACAACAPSAGDIEAEIVVNAGGMFAAEIGRMAGVRVPVVPMAHEYLVTQPFRDRDGGHLPTLRDPDLLIYFREEGGGLVMGGYERHCAPSSLTDDGVGYDAIPPDFNGRLLEEDWDRFEEIVENSPSAGAGDGRRQRHAADQRARGVHARQRVLPRRDRGRAGYFVAAGFCAHGLAGAGGSARSMAEWIADGEPSLDLWHMDIRRFGAQYRSPAIHAQAREGGLRDLLRHQVPGLRAPGRAAVADVRRPCRGTRARRRRSARSRAGSA